MNSNKMLVAKKENWDFTYPDDWTSVTWVINYDMSYVIKINIKPELEAWERDGFPTPITKDITGKMEKGSFTALKTILETDQWRTPGLEIIACDGVAWKIDFYSIEGELLRSSGEIGYIYGEEVLGRIVNMLPDTDESYDASAFVDVIRHWLKDTSVIKMDVC